MIVCRYCRELVRDGSRPGVTRETCRPCRRLSPAAVLEVREAQAIAEAVGLELLPGWLVLEGDAAHVAPVYLSRFLELGAAAPSRELPRLLARSLRYASRDAAYALAVLLSGTDSGELASLTQRLAFGVPLPTRRD